LTTSNTISALPKPNKQPQLSKRTPDSRLKGTFASFIYHVVYLERKLRGFNPLVLDNAAKIRKTDRTLGCGKTFHVQQAQWFKDPKEPPVDVAVKEIVANDEDISRSDLNC
jgi:hypothetical protein